MSLLMDNTRYFAKEIGPRPAGTEEEQQAALYITEQLQKEAGFTSTIEEFQRRTRPDLSHAILAAVMIVATVLAMVVPVASIPAFVVGAAAAAVMIMEVMGTPLLSRVLARGASQNVVAKYQPNPENEGTSRAVTRKLILVAHYDSGRVTPALLKRFNQGKTPLEVIAAGAMGVEALLLLLRIFIAISGGGILVILNVLSVVALLVCAVPLVKLALMNSAAFNEGANNNATGASALVTIAQRISRGSVSEADLEEFAENVTIHGPQAAADAGLVPEGATLDYQANATGAASPEPEASGVERLLAAKEAIAALTGKPVERRVYSEFPEDDIVPGQEAATDAPEAPEAGAPVENEAFTQVPDEEFEAAFTAFRPGESSVTPAGMTGAIGVVAKQESSTAQAVAAATAATPPEEREQGEDAGGFQNAPSWFVAAQKNARKPSMGNQEVHRSRYTEAMEHAEQERLEREQERIAAEEAARAAEIEAQERQARAALEAQRQAEAKAKADADRAAAEAKATAPVEVEQVTVEEAVEVQSDSSSTGHMPRYLDDATDARMGQREKAVKAQLVSEETIDEPAKANAPTGAAARAAALTGSTRPFNPSKDGGVIDNNASESDKKDDAPVSRLDRLQSLRASVPSLSGIIRTKDSARKEVAKTVPDPLNVPTPMDSPASIGRHGTAAPSPVSRRSPLGGPSADDLSKVPGINGGAVAVREETVDYDMTFSNDFNPQFGNDEDFAAHLAPDYDQPVDDFGGFDDGMNAHDDYDEPKKEGFFSRFRHKKQSETMESPQEWLGVDDDFDARSVGRARGGWESFRDGGLDQGDPFGADDHDTFGDFGTDDDSPSRNRRRWEGGAASRMSLGHVSTRSGEDAEADEVVPDIPPEAEQDRFITGAIERIYHFRNPAFNTEIWFVAVGCDADGTHDGIHAFLDKHKSEMRGSTVIEIESLGAGALSVASREGAFKKISASSRIKRYTRDAVAATGIKLDEVDLSGTESIASIVQKAGFQSMHLFGAEDGRPALKGSADDLIENVDELVLEDYTNFVMELLKR